MFIEMVLILVCILIAVVLLGALVGREPPKTVYFSVRDHKKLTENFEGVLNREQGVDIMQFVDNPYVLIIPENYGEGDVDIIDHLKSDNIKCTDSIYWADLKLTSGMVVLEVDYTSNRLVLNKIEVG